MDVALDTNIFFADRELRSTPFQVLFNYLRQTRSHLLLLEPVRVEMEAKVYDKLSTLALEIESSLKKATKEGLGPVPAFDRGEVVQGSFEEWRNKWRESLLPVQMAVPYRVELLPEALSRAANRRAPCEGGAMRDAVVWLTLMDFLKRYPRGGPVAFITTDSDFTSKEQLGGETQNRLHWQLKAEVEEAGCEVLHYSSLHDFNLEHAESLRGYTPEWVYERMDKQFLDAIIRSTIDSHTRAFTIADSDLRDFYEPVAFHDIYMLDWSIDAVHAWPNEDDAVILELIVGCEAAREADCDLVRRPYYRMESAFDEDGELRSGLTLVCTIEAEVVVSAQVNGESVTLGDSKLWHVR